MKDILNVGYIMVIAGMIANVIKGISPHFRALEIEAETAGILIIIYTSIKFYIYGRRKIDD